MQNYAAPKSKVPEEEMKRRYQAYLDNGKSCKKAAKALGISYSSVQNIVSRLEGKCVRCGKKVEGIRSRTLCPYCLQLNQQKCAEKRKRLRENNICTCCGVNPALSGSYCSECREKGRELYRNTRDRNLPLGLCMLCDEPAVKDKKYCSYHLEKQKIINERRRNMQCFDGLKDRVLDRDSYTCQCCGLVGTNERIKGSTWLEIHHINGRSNKMSNLITLCNKCHRAVTYLHTNPSPNAVMKFIHKHYASLLRD